MSDKHVVIGVWKVLRPDIRQYKQQSIEIELSQSIAIEVPDEYVYKSVTSDKGEVTDILTPAGMVYVQRQLEALYSTEVPTETPNDGWSSNKPVATDDGWDVVKDVTDLTVKAEPATAKVDGWGDEPMFEEAQATVPDTEVWNPDDEAWEES